MCIRPGRLRSFPRNTCWSHGEALGHSRWTISHLWLARLPWAVRRGNLRCCVIFGTSADGLPSSDGGLLGSRVCWEHCSGRLQAAAGRAPGRFPGQKALCPLVARRGVSVAARWSQRHCGWCSAPVATAVVCLLRESSLEPLTGSLTVATDISRWWPAGLPWASGRGNSRLCVAEVNHQGHRLGSAAVVVVGLTGVPPFGVAGGLDLAEFRLVELA